MIILQRKRILFILVAVIVSVCSYFMGASFMYQNGKTIETISLPVSGKTVILDAGHRAEKTREQNQKMESQKPKRIYKSRKKYKTY